MPATGVIVLAAFSALCLGATCRFAWLARHQVTETTAGNAGSWAVAAVVCLMINIPVQVAASHETPGLADAWQYFAAVMLLTPLITILGARRPGCDAWNWFVILPLIVVLQWPSVTQLVSGGTHSHIELPTPTAIGFLFVLVMGAGNYLATGVSILAMAGMAACVLVLWPVTEWKSPDRLASLAISSALLSFASFRYYRYLNDIIPSTPAEHSSPLRLWQTFRDLYGAVWATRVAERINQFAERESWPVRLTLAGFVDAPIGQKDDSLTLTPDQDIPDRVLQVLCWVLRRFLDDSFLRRFVSERIPLNQPPG